MSKGDKGKSSEIAGKIVKSLSDLASALESGEPIGRMFTCRRITLDLEPILYDPRTVRSTRQLLRVSQSVFAKFLGVKASTVQGWEQAKQTPSDMACRFMDEIQRDPEYWRKRLRNVIRVKTSNSSVQAK
jgi:putative transcriptional regulator